LGLVFNSKKEFDSSDNEWEIESTDGSEQAEHIEDGGDSSSLSRKHGKGRKFIGKVAKAVKTKTASTGRTVVRKTTNTGKNVVLGGFNAGRSILPLRSKNPPMKEPKSATKRQARKRREKDLDVDVRSKSMR
jgi:hypothetical protein